MQDASLNLYSRTQIQACEKLAVSKLHISESELMERAGKAAFETLKTCFPEVRKILVYCGGGNNAGDGYVLATLAHLAGFTVTINQFKPASQLPLTAQVKAWQAIDAEVPLQSMEEASDIEADLIVDALVGIGLQGPLKEPLVTAINQINASGLPVFSLDIPSGLNADTGTVESTAVKASLTLTFIGYKKGLFTAEGPDHCGKILCHTLHLESVLAHLTPFATTLSPAYLPRRLKNCHKGDFGHVLIIGGNEGMTGAVNLAAEAALRVGAGMVTVGIKAGLQAYSPFLAEVMVYGLDSAKDLEPLLKKASICLIGPGLGLDDWAKAVFTRVIASPLPMIIDAQALRLLAESPQKDDNWVLTPHPGEAAALLDLPIHKIEADRFLTLQTLQKHYGGTVILKGAGSLIKGDESLFKLCKEGNPGMSTAGMGDVLAGMVAGLAAQKLTLANAASLAVYIHAKAADLAVQKKGERGLLASDLMPYIRQLVNT